MREKEFIKKCLKYREYTPPIFHTEFANKRQLEVLCTVIDTLEASGIAFAVVWRNKRHDKELNISTFGFFKPKEKEQILNEVKALYGNGNIFNSFTLN